MVGVCSCIGMFSPLDAAGTVVVTTEDSVAEKDTWREGGQGSPLVGDTKYFKRKTTKRGSTKKTNNGHTTHRQTR